MVAEKAVEAARAQVKAVDSSIEAAQASVAAIRDMEAYLRVTAPFSRHHHRAQRAPWSARRAVRRRGAGAHVPPGAELAAAAGGGGAGGGCFGHRPRRAGGLHGSRRGPPKRSPAWWRASAQSMDPKTRSMAVELDVNNARGRLAPGMYPTVQWPVRKARPGAAGARHRRGHHHRAHLRHPRPRRRRRVGAGDQGRRGGDTGRGSGSLESRGLGGRARLG